MTIVHAFSLGDLPDRSCSARGQLFEPLIAARDCLEQGRVKARMRTSYRPIFVRANSSQLRFCSFICSGRLRSPRSVALANPRQMLAEQSASDEFEESAHTLNCDISVSSR